MDHESKDRIAALEAEVLELRTRLGRIERARKQEAEALKQARELEQWKKLVPQMRRIYP